MSQGSVMSDAAAPLVRRGRRNAHYTAISNSLIDHPSLSPDARIALIYLLSKPDDWQLQIRDLRRVLGTGDRPCGRDKAYKVVKELKESAYVIAVEELRSGRFHGITYYVFDEPVDDPEAFKAEFGVASKRLSRREPDASALALSPHPENPETVSSPRPEFQDTEKQHLTKNRKTQTPESPLQSPRPAVSSGRAGVGGGGEDFSKLWSDWPERERPRERGLAERLFGALSQPDRIAARRYASVYRDQERRRGRPGRMIPYLREGLFAEFDGGPELTSDGYFVITPERPEWSVWADHLAARISPANWAKQMALGYLLCRTRSPEQQIDQTVARRDTARSALGVQ
jgi:hypothetical protein